MVAKINRLIGRIIFCLFLCTAGLIKPAVAGNMVLISDAETQNYLSAIIKPLFRAAGLPFNANNIFIVNDNSLNAFVSEGNYVFVNTGTLLEADNTNELTGILAHETGHITGGHIVRQKLKMEDMQYVMLGSLIAAGATAVSTGRGDAAMAILLGSQSSALNSMLHYQVQEERSADESAVKLLNKTHQSTDGLKKFMRKIKRKYALSGVEENSYFRTHPLTSERISHFEEASKSNHYPAASSLDNDLKLIQAKLSGFLLEKNKAERRYPRKNKSTEAKYAQSILSFRSGDMPHALALINELIEEQPQNPYFHELKGQFLFETGKIKDSITSYEQALKLLPNNYLLQISMAHSMLESKDKSTTQNAVNLLNKSLITHKTSFAWQLLARGYNTLGDKASSMYAAAEYSYAIGNLKAAESQLQAAAKISKNKSLNLKIADLKERVKADLKKQ
ncbi:MAG: M48 family metalloprotease [Alphaproteobacteria bacterium]